MQSASWKVTVVVYDSSPPWHDIDSSISVGRYRGVERPESVLCVEEQGSRVVTDNIDNSIILPSLESIRIMQARNRRRDDPIGAKACSSVKANLLEPGLVERNLLR